MASLAPSTVLPTPADAAAFQSRMPAAGCFYVTKISL